MEVICLESEALFLLIDQLFEHIQEKYGAVPDKWIDDKEAMRILKIKARSTLQKLRDEGHIKFSQPSKKLILYDRDSIDAYLEKHARYPF